MDGLCGMHTYILTVNGSLSRCFSRCEILLGSKIKENAVERVQIVAFKLAAQFSEQVNLLGCEAIVVANVISIWHFDPAAITSADSLNRI